MNAVVETGRLILRPLLVEDRQAVLDLLTDAEIMRFVGPRRALSETEALAWFGDFLHNQVLSPNRRAVALRADGQLIGFCGVKLVDGLPDFGCFFRRRFWRQGYAAEACRAVLPQLWECWGEQLDIFIADANGASVSLAEKLGLIRGAEVRRHDEAGALYLYRPPSISDIATE